jgi:hypothetical protein
VDLRTTQLRILRGRDEIATECDLEATAEASPLDQGHQGRKEQVVHRPQQCMELGKHVPDQVRGVFRHACAIAELRSRSLQHHQLQGRVGGGFRQGLYQLPHQGAVHDVGGCWAELPIREPRGREAGGRLYCSSSRFTACGAARSDSLSP